MFKLRKFRQCFRKDYECNRLTSGILQLNNNTHFVIDETKLQSGKLNESGVKAVGAFSKAIKTQTVQYDFGFNTTQEFDCDIPFLVLSEGKSMLPVSEWGIIKGEFYTKRGIY